MSCYFWSRLSGNQRNSPTCGESDDCQYKFWGLYRQKTEYLEKVNCMDEFIVNCLMQL